LPRPYFAKELIAGLGLELEYDVTIIGCHVQWHIAIIALMNVSRLLTKLLVGQSVRDYTYSDCSIITRELKYCALQTMQ